MHAAAGPGSSPAVIEPHQFASGVTLPFWPGALAAAAVRSGSPRRPSSRSSSRRAPLCAAGEVDARSSCLSARREVDPRRELPVEERRDWHRERRRRCRRARPGRRIPRARARRRPGRPDRRRSSCSTMPVVNARPVVSSSRRNRSPPSTMMFMRPSSSASSTSATRARVPTSCTAPSPVVRARPNSVLVLEALVDQLAVARLEDVKRDPLGRDEHDRQREETELRHACSVGDSPARAPGDRSGHPHACGPGRVPAR